jgi:hypothetical protein
MATCNGCGGTVGRDCFNQQECEWIAQDQQARHMAKQYAPDTTELEQRLVRLEALVNHLCNIAGVPLTFNPNNKEA